ncbi:hypothetical protein E2C01_094032 [Portunus trituberculatus]|uniref:Uncharacterized protein n=1 Tax=Portunus trituberculatus TaxID=210409 RepID=A0A5B7K215_PORTR|nr:hypothetical protein [Portunus trituberculatus]
MHEGRLTAPFYSYLPFMGLPISGVLESRATLDQPKSTATGRIFPVAYRSGPYIPIFDIYSTVSGREREGGW